MVKAGKLLIMLGLVLISIFSIMITVQAKNDVKHKRAEDIGLAYKNVEEADKVVAYVNNEPITAGEFIATYASVQNNFDLLQQDAPKLESKGKEIVNDTSKLLNKYSHGTIALAKQLSDTAAYVEATKKGLLKSDQEVKDYIQSIRKMENSSLELQAIIQLVGEERYWNNLMPRLLKKQMTIGALKAQVMFEQKDWVQYKYNLAQNAALKIVDNKLISSTKEEALNYLKELQEIRK